VAHIFSFNDWAGASTDRNDPTRSETVFSTRGVAPRDVLLLSAALLALSLLLFAHLSRQTLLVAVAIAALGVFYSHPRLNGKGTPIISSCPHLVGGVLHFLLGYSLFSPIDQSGILIGLFFALTFTAGHLNQEVRDYDGDRLNGVHTNAVAFGKTPAFLAGLVVFTLAYTDLFLLAGWASCLPRWRSCRWRSIRSTSCGRSGPCAPDSPSRTSLDSRAATGCSTERSV
jgi:4-hydroxybenzoate polyprenyltransferase